MSQTLLLVVMWAPVTNMQVWSWSRMGLYGQAVSSGRRAVFDNNKWVHDAAAHALVNTRARQRFVYDRDKIVGVYYELSPLIDSTRSRRLRAPIDANVRIPTLARILHKGTRPCSLFCSFEHTKFRWNSLAQIYVDKLQRKGIFYCWHKHLRGLLW